MSSLFDAPDLNRAPPKRFSYEPNYIYDEADDNFGDDNFDAYDNAESPVTAKKNKDKKEKKKSSNKIKKEKKERVHSPVSPRSRRRSPTPPRRSSTPSTVAQQNSEPEDDYYDDDFDETPAEDDYISSVHTSESKKGSRRNSSPSTQDQERIMREALERHLKEKEEKQELLIRQLKLDQQERELANRQRQVALEEEIAALKAQQAEIRAAQAAKATSEVEEKRASHADPHELAMPGGEGDSGQDSRAMELQRRRRRERERAVVLKRAEEESAAHALFQRLAQDVREVFHELNLSVVAAEKERLIKDERYRKEREMRDRREEAERSEKLHRELKERESREEKFWNAIEQREDKFRSLVETRLHQDEAEREDRLKRDLEERATRLRNERELNESLERLEKERRSKADEELRQRDNVMLQTQLEEMRGHFRSQTEELRHQMELDRQHAEELHKAEIAMIEKRHEASLQQQQQHHAHHLAVVESHVSNTSKLEKLVQHIHSEVEASQKLHDKLIQERLDTLSSKERDMEEQKALLNVMMEDVKKSKEDLEKERCRIAALTAKFELSVTNFTRNSEEDRRLFQDAFSRQETLRQQVEKDRKLMISEVAHDRKVLEQQHEEFLARKLEMMNEVHTERASIAKERLEANAARERQNREETDLLQSLHTREEEYRMKLDAMEEDRLAVQQMKIEHQRMVDDVTHERDLLRREQAQFDVEKEELLRHFEAIRQRAEEAGVSQERMRRQLIEERAAKEVPRLASSVIAADNGNAQFSNVAAASRFQIDLAGQRAILQKIS